MRRALALLNQNCRLAARLISDSHERELTSLEKAGLQIHLLGCRSCRRYREQARMIDELTIAVCGQADVTTLLPPEAHQRIRDKLAGHSQ